MKTLISFLAIFLAVVSSCHGQEYDSLFSRLRGISNGGTDYFNVDGIEISVQSQQEEFSKKNILKKFKWSRVKEKDLTSADSSLNTLNFYIANTEETAPGVVQHTSTYFIENAQKGITAMVFGSVNKKDREFEHQFIKLYFSNSIPPSVYESAQVDSINFSGRMIGLGKACRWMGVNNMQCPGYGQMNWSVHKTLEDAAASVDAQYNVIKARKQGKIVSEEVVNVIFEGTEVKVKRAVFDFKGVSSLLVGISGGKTLTIYFVAAPGKQHYVSCVMSFWNNDTINPSGLPPLMEEVMKLK